LGTAPASARDQFTTDLSSALQIAGTANVRKTDNSRASIFGHWETFCKSLNIPSCLHSIRDAETKVTYLLVFGLRYSQEGKKNQSVTANTVEDALLAVGTGIANLGRPDPRKEVPGSTRNHPLLASFLKALRNKDDPAKRSYPANVPIIRNMYNILDFDHEVDGQANRHVLDLTITAFYWLLRPAEYTKSTSAGRSQAFEFKDVAFYIGDTVYNATDKSLNDVNITSVHAAALTFTDQKNSVRGEQVAQRATSDPLLCPAKALFRLTQHLRDHDAPPDTALCEYYDSSNTLSSIKSAYITNGLRYSAADMQATSGIDPKLLSARSLRPGGATALLCANIDKDAIQLLGRWKSDAMLRYLRIQAHVHSMNYAQLMLDHGSYTFAPGTFTAAADMPLPQETPTAFIEVLNHHELFDEDDE
jgi:hypothetical protein